MTTSLTWVDAFTDRPFGGNPAGICLVDPPLAEDRMQSLAFELGIAETAFVTPGADATTFGLRWFTAAAEVDLCGHATLAAAHALLVRGVVDGTAAVTFHTRSGPLVASFEGDRISLDFPAVPMTDAPLPGSLERAWDAADVVATGATDFFSVVVLGSEAVVRDYRPVLAAVAAVDRGALLVAAAADATADADYVLRVFGPKIGIDEDAATGAAQCTAGPYWSATLDRPALVARQLSGRGAVLYVRPDGERVHIAGNAVAVFDGHLC